MFYDPDFVWRTQTKIIRCPESVSGEFVIPDGITSIGDSAFNGCTGLTSITIPSSVMSIGIGTFSGCTGLTEVTYGGTVEQWYAIGYDLGYGFDDVDITCRDGKAIFRIQKGTSDGTEYTSVNGLTPYGKANCTEIALPEGVTEIGYYAFSGCTGLAGITIPSSVTKIGYSAFSGCNGLTSITIPDSVTEIGDNVFYNCSSLTDLYVNQAESTLLDNAYVPKGCTIHWNSTGPESV